ncbi:MAG: CDP-diacylglycerol--glycerol-3-phosphate 3-phosphatidyltransferase [bacterium]
MNNNNNNIYNLPNILTICRILIVPVIFALLFFKKEVYELYAALFFVLAMGTDFIDGYIARKRNIITTFGTFLDPIADKILVITILIMLIPLHRIPAWMVVIIIIREIFITGLRAIAGEKGLVIPAGNIGKWKTSFQMFGIFFLLIYYNHFYINFGAVGYWLILFSILLSIYSSYKYFIGASKIIFN